MISGVSSSTNTSALVSSSNSSSSNSSSLTYNQQQVINDVLSNYDASSLTKSDAQDIVSAFDDAGITASKDLADAMSSLGFDAQEVGTLAGVGAQSAGGMQAGGMPPPPPPSSNEVDNVSSLLETLFNSDSQNSTTSDATSVDTVTDYTSRILNLNENSKQSIMDLFDQYSSDNSGLSSDETASLIKTQLNSILSDSSNYNHSYVYA